MRERIAVFYLAKGKAQLTVTFMGWGTALKGRMANIVGKLKDARRRLVEASRALSPRHKGTEVEHFRSAQQKVLELERELAAGRREPHAVPSDFPVRWDIGAPCPVLMQSDHRTFLVFNVRQPRPDWDGGTPELVDPGAGEPMSLCTVEFTDCVSAKLGHPNDEVLSGHPLWQRGLEPYSAQIVVNSPWTAEVAKTNSVHMFDKPKTWESLKHYVFWFHDTTFECLADGYEFELTNEAMAQALRRVQTKLIE